MHKTCTVIKCTYIKITLLWSWLHAWKSFLSCIILPKMGLSLKNGKRALSFVLQAGVDGTGETEKIKSITLQSIHFIIISHGLSG